MHLAGFQTLGCLIISSSLYTAQTHRDCLESLGLRGGGKKPFQGGMGRGGEKMETENSQGQTSQRDFTGKTLLRNEIIS